MNIKKTFALSLFVILLLAGFVAATVTLTVSPSTLEFTQDNQQKTLTVTNSGDETATISVSPTTTFVTDGTTTVNFGFSSGFSLSAGNSSTFTVTSSEDPQLLNFGKHSTDVNITGNGTIGPNDSKTVTLTAVSSFCSAGSVGGNLTIKTVDINNKDGDDDEWELLDEIEVEVEVKNEGADDIDEVFVEIALFDANGRDNADDLEFDNVDEEELDLGDIRDGDKEKDTYTFRVPADFEDGNYKLAIKAYSDDLGESVECVDFSDDLSDDFFETINIDRVSDEERFIVVDDIIIDDQASCGDTVSGTFTVFNIGDESQERVLITMKNLDLGVDKEFEITSDLDEGDDETLSFTFQIPQNAEETLHAIEFRTEYDYKRGIYREISEDKFFGFVNVLGCSGGPVSPTDLLILASLDSDAKAGEELIVSSTLTNVADETIVVEVDARAFQSWADLDSISQRTLTLNPGQSRTVTFTFNVDNDASGDQSFIIETSHNGMIDIQEVEVNIREDGARGSGITGFASFGDGGSLVWVIAIVNIILIILIILVAVRLSRR